MPFTTEGSPLKTLSVVLSRGNLRMGVGLNCVLDCDIFFIVVILSLLQ